MTDDERFHALKLVRNILSRGHRISVNDGEEFCLRGSRREDDVMGHLGATDEEYIFVIDGDVDRPLGTFMLVWGNSGPELVADCTDNALCDTICREVFGDH